MTIELLNMDCLEYMAGLPDKAFDLCIVDPPYGIGEDGGRFRDRVGGGHRVLPKKNWDSSVPSADYWNELFRVSVDQIVWGGNYFTNNLPQSRCWIYWDKLMGGDFSDGELAWTSMDRVLKKYTECNKAGGKIHPTQKPVALYEWLLTHYAKPGQRILDTHLGSGSSAIAAHNLGFDFVGTELDADYYAAAVRRFEAHKAQQTLFQPDDYTMVERDAFQESFL